ncbi:sigma-70 family RNA polymerase sigma factor [Diaminobutyricimonas sp. TR449]|uniref:sigma-70 family RNA polymerase sigma factor n=1 Tax=Diaminobutyricimonas sp. TR449 TaxID=2708076 RepID=UPI0014217248|nr:sigma-70 family RNA polymerase sigma factor [Diaminobutyricimonas sp. TR449]
MNRVERNQLVVENLPLVGYLVSEVARRATHLSREDLASAGSVALITAADSYKAELGIPFGAFARRRILGAFADEMRSSDWASRSTRRRIKETQAVQDTLSAALGRAPSVDEIAAALGVDREMAAAGLSDASRVVSTLDEATADILAADAPLPEEGILTAERFAFLRAAVHALPERMRLIVEAVYFHDRSVKEIADELGITHSAVSQQRSEAIRLLHDGLVTHYADDPDVKSETKSRIAASSRSAYLDRLGASSAAMRSAASGLAQLASASLRVPA